MASTARNLPADRARMEEARLLLDCQGAWNGVGARIRSDAPLDAAAAAANTLSPWCESRCVYLFCAREASLASSLSAADMRGRYAADLSLAVTRGPIGSCLRPVAVPFVNRGAPQSPLLPAALATSRTPEVGSRLAGAPLASAFSESRAHWAVRRPAVLVAHG